MSRIAGKKIKIISTVNTHIIQLNKPISKARCNSVSNLERSENKNYILCIEILKFNLGADPLKRPGSFKIWSIRLCASSLRTKDNWASMYYSARGYGWEVRRVFKDVVSDRLMQTKPLPLAPKSSLFSLSLNLIHVVT